MEAMQTAHGLALQLTGQMHRPSHGTDDKKFMISQAETESNGFRGTAEEDGPRGTVSMN